jgi:hypothetical protein
MWISALVTLLNLGLAATIAGRLLWRARSGTRGPELWLAGYFLLAAFLGSMLSISVYSSLGSDGFRFSDATASLLLAGSTLSASIGAVCVYVFTWRTFRPDAARARALVACAAAVFASTWLYQWIAGAFMVVVFPGPAYWIERSVYCGAFLWVGIESFRYFGALRRRLRIGLADPVLTHRFWLWGMWSVATLVFALCDLAARIAYVWTTGETEVLVVEKAMPIIHATVAISALLGLTAATCLGLTFFPPRRYTAWVASHYAHDTEAARQAV